ncbi:MAG: hypothetical protein K6B44_06355 [Lachnospiraceae bacterium]|nr:hypothetical protein [Lachnospiraceae bacterium]
MKKRGLLLTLTLCLSLLGGCGANNLEPEIRNTVIDAKDAVQSIGTKEENKAPDFSGRWEAYSTESRVLNIKSAGENEYSISAEYVYDDGTTGKWDISATYYDSTGLVEYTGASYTHITADSEETVYTDGDGYFWLNSDNTLGWMSGRSEDDGIDGSVDFYK